MSPVRCSRCAKRRARFAGPPRGQRLRFGCRHGPFLSSDTVFRFLPFGALAAPTASPLRGPAAFRSRRTFTSGAACPVTENVCSELGMLPAFYPRAYFLVLGDAIFLLLRALCSARQMSWEFCLLFSPGHVLLYCGDAFFYLLGRFASSILRLTRFLGGPKERAFCRAFLRRHFTSAEVEIGFAFSYPNCAIAPRGRKFSPEKLPALGHRGR
jgi:hypothetical protein